MVQYVERLREDAAKLPAFVAEQRAELPRTCDSIYLGGGTPTLLQPDELKKLFSNIRDQFDVSTWAEITVECAPGTLTDEMILILRDCGVNRVSLGVQSFVDKEAASVARLHTGRQAASDIARLRAAGITNINVDLIAGLPHQTAESWEYSLGQAIACGVPHVSVYMLEIDDDSRLGRELIAGGARYHAHFVPDEDLTAEFYEIACERLNASEINQYEISNFAREGFRSHHNMKYWTRQPYVGLGVDAHSMLPASGFLKNSGIDALRIAATSSFENFFISAELETTRITSAQAREETFFLGLRLNEGINLQEIGPGLHEYGPVIEELAAGGLLIHEGNNLRLTHRGRMLSNEVFERFIGSDEMLSRT